MLPLHPEKFANCVLDRCSSTNDYARILGDRGYPHGTWVAVGIQEAGRGRLGRKWESLEGNLFLSLVVRLEPRALWSWVPLVSTMALVDLFTAKPYRLPL